MRMPSNIFPRDFVHTHPRDAQADMRRAKEWVQQYTPVQVEVSDRQYAHISNLLGHCPKDFEDTKLIFTDAPSSI